MTKAFDDKVDIITMSLGSVLGWSEYGMDVIASRIAAQGVFVSVAAGNDGSDGMMNAETPASGLNVAAVGSVDSPYFFGWTAETDTKQEIVIPLCALISSTTWVQNASLGRGQFISPRRQTPILLQMPATHCPQIHPISPSTLS